MSGDLELRKAFFEESVEILERLESDMTTLEKDPKNDNVINSVFRSLHTIKGNSSFLSLDKITKISHAAETLLDKTRKKEISVTKELLQIVNQVVAELKVMIEEQEINLDISKTVQVIEKFMSGDVSAVAGLSAAISEAQTTSHPKIQTSTFIKVDENKIAKMISLVSELELMRYSMEKLPEKMELIGPSGSDLRFEMELQVSKLSRMVKSLSGLMFGVRLVPVNMVFQRFPRVVAELAQKLGKDIKLEIANGEAELDKNIVEAIADPMTHLIRNSADHGIETVEERKKIGKSKSGIIRLNSFVRGNFVYIEITDDGKGIDGDKILAIAVKKGIVPAEKAEHFTESQKLALIFAPGFSTAEKVTDISGRGVGMDVVKSNINKLKGTVIIDSKVGRGTVIQLRFPMSMVVIFSLFIKINENVCAFPVDQIDESIDYFPNELLDHIPEGEKKEKYLQLFSLRSLLWGGEDNPSVKKTYHVLRFKDDNGKNFGFIVDDYTSIEDAIVQSLDSYIAAMPGIQGASVRKDGSVAIVLNTESIMELAKKAKPFALAKIKDKAATEPKGLSDFLSFATGKSA